MKKLFSVVALLIFGAAFLVADEAVLFDYSVKADVLETGYDWIENSKAVGISGYYVPGKNLSEPVVSEKYGLCIRTDEAPNCDSNYAIEFVKPNFNEPSTGAGYIQNAAAIKAMEITLTLNRGYDEVSVEWLQNGKLCSRKFKASDCESAVESMIEFTVKLDFSEYVSDVKNRSNAQVPVAGLRLTDIALKRIKVTTHAAPGTWAYSPTSIVGVKKVSVIYDKAVTDEAYQRGLEADETFGIKFDEESKLKLKKDLENEARQRSYNQALMATESFDETKTTETEPNAK